MYILTSNFAFLTWVEEICVMVVITRQVKYVLIDWLIDDDDFCSWGVQVLSSPNLFKKTTHHRKLKMQ